MKRYIFSCFFTCVFFISNAQIQFSGNKKFTKADSLRGTLSIYRSCYDVLMYDLDIKVEIDNKFISGSNTIKFLANQSFRTLQIDLFSNMKIEKVLFMEKDLVFSRSHNAVFVTFPSDIPKASTQTIKVLYSGNPQVAKNPPWDGGFSWTKDKEGNPFVGVSCQGTGASLWYPCKDHQSDEPNEMLIRVAVPDGFDEVSNGRLKRTVHLDDGYTKFEWYVSNPINNYDVTLNIAKYKHFSGVYKNKNYKDSLTLDYYVIPSNFEKAEKQFEQVKPMLDAYYYYFGEYPFVEDGYKLVEAPYLGMEHQSCIAYGNKYKNGYLGFDMSGAGFKFDYIIIHESAHEWWGNSITTNDIADMWIHEGFGTYSEALYIEYLYGHDAYLEYINAEKKHLSNDVPIIGNYNVNNEGSGDMYPKGALLIHTIRSIIDDDKKFFQILSGIQKKFQHQCVNSTEIENYFSEQSEINMNPIFNLYLRNVPIPTLEVIIYRDFLDLKANYYFSFKNSRTNENDKLLEHSHFSMPVKITSEKNKYVIVFPDTDGQQTINLKDMHPEDFKVATELFYIDSHVIIEKGAEEEH